MRAARLHNEYSCEERENMKAARFAYQSTAMRKERRGSCKDLEIIEQM
jgi:hypothetical protein